MKTPIATVLAASALALNAQAENPQAPYQEEKLFPTDSETATTEAAEKTQDDLMKSNVDAMMMSDEIQSVAVFNKQDEKLGNISQLVVNPTTGKIEHAIVSVGGFLGIGDRLVAVPWENFELKKVWDSNEVEPEVTSVETSLETDPKVAPEAPANLPGTPVTTTEETTEVEAAVGSTTQEASQELAAADLPKSEDKLVDPLVSDPTEPAVTETAQDQTPQQIEVAEIESTETEATQAEAAETELALTETTTPSNATETETEVEATETSIAETDTDLEEQNQLIEKLKSEAKEEKINEVAELRIYLDADAARLENAPVFDPETKFISSSDGADNAVKTYWNEMKIEKTESSEAETSEQAVGNETKNY